VLASNEDWIIEALAGARRFLCLEVDDELSHNKILAKKTALTPAVDFATVLYNWDISKFNGNDVPSTTALIFQQTQSIPKWADWLHRQLLEGKFEYDGYHYAMDEGHDVKKINLYNAFLKDHRGPHPIRYNIFMKHVIKVLKLEDGKNLIRRTVGGKKIGFIKWPGLEYLRAAFKSVFHLDFDEVEGEDEEKEDVNKAVTSQIIKLQSLLFKLPESDKSVYKTLLDTLKSSIIPAHQPRTHNLQTNELNDSDDITALIEELTE